MKKTKVSVRTGTANEFFGRVREHAAKLDRGESIPAEITITFEDPEELLNVLTAERVRLLRRAKAGSLPISALASGLRRDIRAVKAGGQPVGLSRDSGVVIPTYCNDTVVPVPPAKTPELDRKLLRETGRRLAQGYIEAPPLMAAAAE